MSQPLLPLSRVYDGLVTMPKPLQLLAVLGLLVLAAGLDAVAPPLLSVTALYMLPVLVSVVSTGMRWALLVAVAATILQNFVFAQPASAAIYVLNATFRMLIYGVVIWLALALQQSLASAREEARHDFLTGLLNRRAFHELAVVELQRSRRNGNPFSVIYLDVDDFKNVNDRAGHETGDQVLIAIADTLRATLRRTDICARIGGDEFAAILPEATESKARAAAGNLHEAVARRLAAMQVPCTCSLGVAVFVAAPETVEEMIRRADELMYAVKSAGKGSAQVDIFFGH